MPTVSCSPPSIPATRSTSDCAPGSRRAGCTASATTRSPSFGSSAPSSRGASRPARPTWTLQRTRYWEDARRSVELAAAGPGTAPTADEELQAVLDEVRLDPDGYRLLVDRSLLTALARNAATAVGVDVSPWAHQTALERERRHRGLLEPDQVDGWLEERGMSRADLPAVARRLAVLRWAHEAHRDSVAGEVALTVRSDEVYAQLAARAARKRDVLASLPTRRRRHRRPRGDRVVLPRAARTGGSRGPGRLGIGTRLGPGDRPPTGASSGVVVPAGNRRRRSGERAAEAARRTVALDGDEALHVPPRRHAHGARVGRPHRG